MSPDRAAGFEALRGLPLKGRQYLIANRKDILRKSFLACIVFLALWCFGVALYYGTYHLFFLELPLEDIAKKRVSGADEKFRYDGVVYFNGTRIGDGQRVRFVWQGVRALDRAPAKAVEIFIRVHQKEGLSGIAGTLGELRIVQSAAGVSSHVESVPLEALELQRVKVPLLSFTRRTAFNVIFRAHDPERVNEIVFATNIRNVNLSGLFWFYLLAAAVLLGIHQFLQRGRHVGTIGLIACVWALAYFVHSGAMISNEYFDEAGSSLRYIGKRAKQIYSVGEISGNMYRGAGYLAIPLAAILIEGEEATSDHNQFLSVYPTVRFLMFYWLILSVAFLLVVIARYYGNGLALLTGILIVTFYPFIVDSYNVQDDAYAIPLMCFFTAFFLREVHGRKWSNLAGMSLVFCAMMTVKVTAAFLLILVPLGFWLQPLIAERRWRDARPLILFSTLLLAFVVGRSLGQSLRAEILPGVPYSGSVFWELVWAPYGLYDHHSAHWFTKSGNLRSRRVAERTGLPEDVSHVRHSKQAEEQVYKPDVVNAVKERPGYFYSTAFVRAHKHALAFFRYTYGGGKVWAQWLRDGFRSSEVISGEEVNGLTRTREAIRYGKKWKIASLVLLTQLVQGDLGLMADCFLILAAVLGIWMLKRWDLRFVLIGCVAVKFAFTVGLHGMVRYMNFVHIVMLFGLAFFLHTLYLMLKDTSLSALTADASARQEGQRSNNPS